MDSKFRTFLFQQHPHETMMNNRNQSNNSSVRSMDSSSVVSEAMTDISASTEPRSNTMSAQWKKKQQQEKFILFLQSLMHILQKRDPTLYRKAQQVLQEQHHEENSESISPSLKTVVGPKYWKAAHKIATDAAPNHKDFDNNSESSMDLDDLEPLPPRCDVKFTRSDVQFLKESNLVKPKKPKVHFSSVQLLKEETKTRQERFWMLIRVLMKYLQAKRPELYDQAKHIVSDCWRHEKKRREGFRALQRNITAQMKELVGSHTWRKSENYLFGILASRARLEDETARLEEVSDYSPGTSRRKDGRVPQLTMSGTNDCSISAKATPNITSEAIVGKRRGKNLSNMFRPPKPEEETTTTIIPMDTFRTTGSDIQRNTIPQEYPRPSKRVRL
jgi:hypothetical protein